MNLDLTSSDAKIVLEALQLLEEKWSKICDTSADEDEVADYGNDLIDVRLLLTSTRESAVAALGKNVTNLDRTLL